ncbi:hypothetical protein U6A24_12730 [Aquimarina gracilis]|uniref:Uncharacterized protein n=1 Tax=Aquimarina gracilis TaxID=874422 RepID=A0ABU5ZWV7_9FLAO|nr:hypothetical protein [Aquimarina gracilis]MEB3346335.1 hypothetical protein [Aquimarina gracilis]
MASDTIKVNGKEVYIVDKEVMKDLVYRAYLKNKNELSGSTCNSETAKKILGCGTTKFYQMQKDPKSKIRKSGVSGKYILESIYAERERLK